MRSHQDLIRELDEGQQRAKDAATNEERQRITIEIILALGENAKNADVERVLLKLQDRVDNPRPKSELDAVLVGFIKNVSIGGP